MKTEELTIENVAGGQVGRIFAAELKLINANMLRSPNAEHRMTLTMDFFYDREGRLAVRPIGSTSCKTTEKLVGEPVHLAMKNNRIVGYQNSQMDLPIDEETAEEEQEDDEQ